MNKYKKKRVKIFFLCYSIIVPNNFVVYYIFMVYYNLKYNIQF